jgi:hypothetical protein
MELIMKSFKKIAGVAVTACAVTCGSSLFSAAEAADGLYRCDDATYGVNATGVYRASDVGNGSNYLYRYEQCTGGHTANANGTVVTAQATLRAATQQLSGLISSRVAAAAAGNGVAVSANGFSASTGVASGGHADKLAVWTSGKYTNVHDSNTATAFQGEIYTILVGADYKLNDRLLVGLSGGYEDADLDTAFNKNNQTNEEGSLEASGWTVAPYASYQVDEIFSVQLSGGYSMLDYDSVRFEAANDERVTGSTDSTRYFVEVGGSGRYAIDDWRLRGGLSYFYAREEKDSFTESDGTAQADLNTNLGQIRANTELGYVWNMFEPFAKVGVQYDASKSATSVSTSQTTPEDDDFGVVLGGGVKLFAAPNITGLIEGSSVELRDEYKEYNALANIRVQF